MSRPTLVFVGLAGRLQLDSSCPILLPEPADLPHHPTPLPGAYLAIVSVEWSAHHALRPARRPVRRPVRRPEPVVPRPGSADRGRGQRVPVRLLRTRPPCAEIPPG